MKHHISVDQIPGGEESLNEVIVDWLSATDEEQYFKLAAITQQNYEIYKETKEMPSEDEFNKCFSEYFTIGKMTELIETAFYNVEAHVEIVLGLDGLLINLVQPYMEGSKFRKHLITYHTSKTKCKVDSLWEFLVKILERKKET